MSITVQNILDYIDTIAPFERSEQWDNSGLLIGDPGQNVTTILLALDVTEEVIFEAEKKGAQLIISHHPIIFQPIKRLMKNSLPALCIQKNLSVLCAHTNLDAAQDGVNDALAGILELTDISPFTVEAVSNRFVLTVYTNKDNTDQVRAAAFEAGAGILGLYEKCSFTVSGEGTFMPVPGAHPHFGQINREERTSENGITFFCDKKDLNRVLQSIRNAHAYEEPVIHVGQDYTQISPGMGRYGFLKSKMTAHEFSCFVKEKLNCGCIRFSHETMIGKVGVCGGAGEDLLLTAKKLGCDAFLTGQVKHSTFLEARKAGITILEAGHYETEFVVLKPLRKLIESNFENIEIKISETETAPYTTV